MDITIGTNIKRLRQESSMTQEQLAELLGVTNVAVSKWERGETMPDIGLLIPIAQVFNVSLDTLMGYDAEKVGAEVDKIVRKHNSLRISGQFDEAKKLLAEAREKYPNDYKIMNACFMDVAGKGPQVLNDRHEELMKMCNCILSGCPDEQIRLEALNMKARLEHAAGRTDAALEILSHFPSRVQTANQKIEQLYSEDTVERLEWTKRNMYSFAELLGFQIVRSIWLDKSLDINERIRRIEYIGDSFEELAEKSSEPVFLVIVRSIFSHFVLQISRVGGYFENILRATDKDLGALKQLADAAETDADLDKLLFQSHGGGGRNFFKFTVKHYKTAQHRFLNELRTHPEYIELLEKYS